MVVRVQQDDPFRCGVQDLLYLLRLLAGLLVQPRVFDSHGQLVGDVRQQLFFVRRPGVGRLPPDHQQAENFVPRTQGHQSGTVEALRVGQGRRPLVCGEVIHEDRLLRSQDVMAQAVRAKRAVV